MNFDSTAGVQMSEAPQVVGDGWRVSVSKPGQLRIRTARPDDSGQYVCHAQNSVRPEISKVIKLMVLGKISYSFSS